MLPSPTGRGIRKPRKKVPVVRDPVGDINAVMRRAAANRAAKQAAAHRNAPIGRTSPGPAVPVVAPGPSGNRAGGKTRLNAPSRPTPIRNAAKKAVAKVVRPVGNRNVAPQPVKRVNPKPPPKGAQKATVGPSKGKKGGKGPGKGGAPAKAGKPTTGPVVDELAARAQAEVSAELDPQIQELKRQAAENKISGAEALARIQQLYGQAGAETEAQRAATAQTYSSTQSTIKDLYDKLTDTTKNTYQNASDEANAEASRLGLQGSDTNVNTSDRDYLSGLAATVGATQQSAVSQAGANSDAMMRRLSAMVAGDAAQKSTESSNTTAELARQLSSQAGILESSRQAKVYALLGQLKDQRAQTQAEAAQQNFLNQIAARKLGISEAQLQANIAKQRADIGIARAKVKLTRKKNETDAAYKARMAAIAANNSSIKAQNAAIAAENAVVDRDLKRSQTMANISKTQQKAASGTGLSSARDYVITNTRGMPGGARIASDINNLLVEYSPITAGKWKNTQYGTPWNKLMNTVRYKRMPRAAQQLLRDAYQRAYGE